MPVNEPRTTVTCDTCGCELEFDLTALAGGGWDDRNIRPKLVQWKWKVENDGDITTCPDCVEDAKDV